MSHETKNKTSVCFVAGKSPKCVTRRPNLASFWKLWYIPTSYSRGDLPDPGIEPGSPTLYTDALPSEPPGKSYTVIHIYMCITVVIF